MPSPNRWIAASEKVAAAGPWFTCASCAHQYRFLVDDGPLCLRCDRLFYPADVMQRAS